MSAVDLTDTEFRQFQQFIYTMAGISLSPAKKALVAGRLHKRLNACRVVDYGAYLKLLASGTAPGEVQTAVDLLTTNETYFFRENKHFDTLHAVLAERPRTSTAYRVWSAASSSGEEAYSIAMVLAQHLGDAAWEVVGTDISTRVLEQARVGHYPMSRAAHIPKEYLKQFCLRGVGAQEGTLLVDKRIRARVSFMQANLNAALPQLGMFDAIFLRNVMIYFDNDTKQQLVARVLSLLRPGGLFFVGHSESISGMANGVEQLAPSMYRKV